MTTGELILELQKYPPESGVGYLIMMRCAPINFTGLRTTKWNPPDGESVEVKCVILSDEEIPTPKNP